MTDQKLTIVIHPNNIGTQVVYVSSREVVIEFTKSNDYNANRHAAEKWRCSETSPEGGSPSVGN